MTNNTIPAKVLAELNRQLNYELGAAYSYRALAAWCAAQELKGFAAYFAKQAEEEQAHADRIMAHLLDRGTQPRLEAIPAPQQTFKSLLEAVQHAQALERANTKSVNTVYEAALAAKDYPAQVLMHWFINEQVEEEAQAASAVARVQAATCAGSLFDLDRHIGKDLKGPAAD